MDDRHQPRYPNVLDLLDAFDLIVNKLRVSFDDYLFRTTDDVQ